MKFKIEVFVLKNLPYSLVRQTEYIEMMSNIWSTKILIIRDINLIIRELFAG